MGQILFKSLWFRRVQNSALLLAIAVGVSLIFAVTLIQYGVTEGLEQARARLGADILVVPSGVAVDPGEILYGGAPANTYMSREIEAKIASIPGIRRTTAQFFSQSLTDECCDTGGPFRLTGFDPETDWLIQPWLKNIGKMQLADNEIIIGTGVNSFPGGVVNILGRPFQVAATLEASGTALDKSILLNMKTAREIAGESPSLAGLWQANGVPEGLVSAVLVETEPDADIAGITAKIEGLDKVDAFSATETKRRIYEQFQVITGLLLAAGIMAVITSAVQLVSRLYALTLERRNEWGLYLALGAAPGRIAGWVMAEAALLCTLGTVAGLAGGYVLYRWSVNFMAAHQAFPFIYPEPAVTLTIAFILLACWLLLSALAAWFPAYRSGRIEPGLIMTRGEFD
ncbi:hypothetical protein P22_3203 [Propionispora sp. 2/2-37]|uniref:ABC transporter permease n=1 Tax=Propionispora sp. 2/2-37 TaxID=1677858 RepID=UPI0006BB6FDE|nr:FtsX-like permease family protein [Propionispora sp. 2/2-37]CUH97077.1 hypothetical protein P22_3203 [Propionispora sp. 2/2-37]